MKYCLSMKIVILQNLGLINEVCFLNSYPKKIYFKYSHKKKNFGLSQSSFLISVFMVRMLIFVVRMSKKVVWTSIQVFRMSIFVVRISKKVVRTSIQVFRISIFVVWISKEVVRSFEITFLSRLIFVYRGIAVVFEVYKINHRAQVIL